MTFDVCDIRSTGAVVPLMHTLFDSVLTSSYGNSSHGSKKLGVVKATLEDGTILVGLDLLEKDADLFVSKVIL